MCDAGCITHFDKKYFEIIKDGTDIRVGKRDVHTGLWRVPIT